MSLLLLLAGSGPPGAVTIVVDPANLTWVGQSVDLVQGGGPTEITVEPADLTWIGQSVTVNAGAPALGSVGAPMAFLPIQYGAAVTIPFDLIKAGTLDFAGAGDWTPATGDVKVSIDGGAFANVGTLPSVLSGTDWGQPLTTGETTGKFISVKIVDSATKAVDDQALKFFTYGHPSAAWPFPFSSTPPANVLQWNSAAVAAPATAGYPAVTIKSGTGTGELSLTAGGVLLQGTTHTNAVIPLVTDLTTKTGFSLANPAGLKKNTAWPNFSFAMYNATTGALMSGLTPVNAQRRIDTGAVAACTNSVTEVSAGIYTIDLAAADLNGDAITLLFTATGAVSRDFQIVTEP
jgi:hypothetical protein